MIDLSIDGSGFTRMERALLSIAKRQIPFAAARALNDVARSAGTTINAHMGETFDRPTPFTQRAVVAPRALAASKEHLVATVTVRPLQAKYLLNEETGGTRTPSENTRRPGAEAIILPGRGLLLDQYGNIPRGELRHLQADAKATARTRARRAAAGKPVDGSVVFLPAGAPGNKANIGGYFRRLADHQLTRLTLFESTTHYTPRFHYRDRVEQIARSQWPDAFRRRLVEAAATAR
jgi:hypothetical protein